MNKTLLKNILYWVMSGLLMLNMIIIELLLFALPLTTPLVMTAGIASIVICVGNILLVEEKYKYEAKHNNSKKDLLKK